ncbi:MAG: xanthine dehydrogenase family protein subunit M [Bryobacteraceae bacterium]
MLAKFSYQRTSSIQEAAAAAAQPETRILAGGTDLLGCLRDGVFQANRLVSINGIKELKGIRPRPGGGLRIGASTTLTEIAESRQILDSYPVLAQAAAAVGSPQLRNQGTLGGNLCQRPRCWYFRGDFHCLRKGGDQCFASAGQNQLHCIFGGYECFMVHPSDTAPALVALDAKVAVTGRSGTRQMPLASFFVLPKTSLVKENVLEPGDVLTEVLLDAPQPGTRGAYRKARERASFDFALAGAAIVLSMAEGKVRTARVVLSGVAPAPWRSPEAEQALVGKPLDAATAEAAATAAVKPAVPLAENAYKVPLVRGILEETLLALAV